MKEQTLTIEQMQELIDVGIDISSASCVWWNFADLGFALMMLDDGKNSITIEEMKKNHGAENVVPAFTLQDIIDLIKSWTEYDFCVTYHKAFLFDLADSDSTKPFRIETGETTIEAAFKLLKWCKENKYL